MDKAAGRERVRAVSYRIGRPKPGTLRLWTIQPIHVWERLRRERTLLVDPGHAAFNRDFRPAYDWMRGQMGDRLAAYEGHYPWWAYDDKIDLRSFRYALRSGTHVRLGLAVPAARVLLSAYGLWHLVLGQSFLPTADGSEDWERSAEAWDAELRRHDVDPRGPLPEQWRSLVETSWGRIFDVDALRETNTIQACFERLEWADVVEVTRFTAAVRSRRA